MNPNKAKAVLFAANNLTSYYETADGIEWEELDALVNALREACDQPQEVNKPKRKS